MKPPSLGSFSPSSMLLTNHLMQAVGYYAGMLSYFWLLATPAVGFLFGCYLYVAVNVFHCHYDEAFSALRIPHYKGFSRIHLKENGDLVIYALAMDQVNAPPLLQYTHS